MPGGELTRNRVMVVDDHPMWLEAMSADLVEAGFDLVATARTGEECLTRARAARPDVVVMDLQIPEPNGAACTSRLVDEFPSISVLIVSASGERADVLCAIKAGAKGYLLKSAPSEELIEGVRQTALGEAVFTPSLAGLILGEFQRMVTTQDPRPSTETQLTPREIEVLRHVAKGLAYREIAEELVVSHRTVQNHVQNVLRKLQLHNRVELTLYAVGKGYHQL